jgi:hypothetical protein
MRVAGLAVDLAIKGRPTTRLVVIDSSDPSSPTSSSSFPCDDVDLAVHLHDAAEAVRSALQGAGVDRVVVRRADRPPRAPNTEGPRLRLLTEGAITAAARSIVVDTRIGTGKDTGDWHGTKKATLDAEAAAVIAGARLHDHYLEALAAALAALALP